MHLILYSKIGCHLCEGLQEKLAQITDLDIQLEIREITTNPDWFDRYQYEIPVLCLQAEGTERPIPRFSPRAGVPQVQQMLQKYSASVDS
ncbi:MAG: glutaredoxin family protein [Chamaesiphon sp.]|nr:glutaredoxin family protein [Chamaesiphon sp.]